MRITVLGATGATGRLLVRQALDRGLQVTAIARDPRSVPEPDRADLRLVEGDVHDPGSIMRAVQDSDVLVSGLGVVKGSRPRTLTAGATAAVRSGVPRVVWLGAFGTGGSASAAGALTRGVLRIVLRRELDDKVAADDTVLAAGGTVFHAGPMHNGAAASEWRTLAIDAAPQRLFPAGVSRATVAAAMVDEAIRGQYPGRIVLPVNGRPRSDGQDPT